MISERYFECIDCIKQRKLESVAILDTAFEGMALCVACFMMSSYIVISERSFECIDCIRQRKLRSVAILAQGIFLAQGGYVERGIRQTHTMAPVFVRPPYVPKERPIDGIFLLDSFGMAGSMAWKGWKTMYTQEALQYVYWRAGLHCVAIQHNGAGYVKLLEAAYVMRRELDTAQAGQRVSFCVIVSMGNDIYKSARMMDEGIDLGLLERVASGMKEVDQYCREYLATSTLIVYGGTSKTWKYDGIMAWLYDQYVTKIIMEISKYGDAIKGSSLGVLDTIDNVGHVDVSSLGIIVNTFVFWALLAQGVPWGGDLYAPHAKSKL